MADTITIDVNDVYILSTTGDQTDDIVGSPFSSWGTATFPSSPHRTITGILNATTGSVATLTGQRGNFLHNMGLGSVATLQYTVIS